MLNAGTAWGACGCVWCVLLRTAGSLSQRVGAVCCHCSRCFKGNWFIFVFFTSLIYRMLDLALGAAADENIVELAVSTANSTSKAIQSCLTMECTPRVDDRCFMPSSAWMCM